MRRHYEKHKYTLLKISIVIILILASSLVFESKYANKIYPGVKLGDMNLSGLDVNEVRSLLNQRVNQINQNGLEFIYNDKGVNISPTISSFSADWSYNVLYFNVSETVTQAFNIGRQGSQFNRTLNKLFGVFSNHKIKFHYELDEGELRKILKDSFGEFEIPAQDASIVFTTQMEADEEKIIFDILPENLGKVVNYNQAIAELTANLDSLNIQAVNLKTTTDYPQIYKNECLNIKTKAQNIISLAPLTLHHNDLEWVVDKTTLAQWLTLKKNKEEIYIDLGKDKIQEFIAAEIADEINKDPIKAKFEVNDGKVTSFQLSENGLRLNEDASIDKIRQEFIIQQNNNVNLVVETLFGDEEEHTIDNFGIQEVIGTGHSRFSGSPSNRRVNIAVGANSLDGLLIKPGEEFSLIKALGEIDASNGYLQELVIKGDKTIPEYGGGLCQIGTTVFRAVLATGLPITARRNHSYRVSYYEPAGTDATIYDPWPDFRFINDTDNYIMIQARIEGDDIYFDFWGKNDGRKVSITDPVIYNITDPEPTKYVETTEIPVGETKCTERAHKGADAYFDYKVIYSDNTEEEPHLIDERFHSHYIPWQEVCLVGVAASSTPEIISE